MHKITKGLKKKKKGKKSKHKEEELFKPEELEAYRQKHQQQEQQEQEKAAASSGGSGGGGGAGGGDEEWKKFNALTAGIDSILKKTQDDLGRIKEESFFQRIPPASETKRKEQEEEEQRRLQQQLEEEEERRQKAEEDAYLAESAIVAVSESETEEEDEDDIFDTAYLDEDIKLAYIPESPTEKDGDDPFDTTIAERAILGPQSAKGKKLVPLGSAVEVLTGRVQAFSHIPTKRPSTRRPHQPQDLLLGDDQEASAEPAGLTAPQEAQRPRSLLDDDELTIDAPVDLTSTSLIQAVQAPAVVDTSKDILKEFDEIAQAEDEDDAEFALLAQESLSKVPAVEILPVVAAAPLKETWNAFGEAECEAEEAEADPFDTTFAENILPGRAELRQIETEILEAQDFEFERVQAADKITELIKSTVHISVTDPAGFRESVSSVSDRVDEEELASLRPAYRDLLGGSNTDLSDLGDAILTPKDTEHIEYADPFDTSTVDQAVAPADIELKILEKELLGDEDDADFDPRRDEPKRLSRPDILAVGHPKSVAFDLTTLDAREDSAKVVKPLTPYYVRDNSIPEALSEESDDPFDTSFARVEPGKAELALIEKELDENEFNPRSRSQIVQQILETVEAKASAVIPDLLCAAAEGTDAKVLTPSGAVESELSYSDPFDTSIASNILPGKTELRLLENELIVSEPAVLKRVLTDPDFNPRTVVSTPPDLLDEPSEGVCVKPLSPAVNFSFEEDDVDPFDTSIAANIGLGSTELKLLESELI